MTHLGNVERYLSTLWDPCRFITQDPNGTPQPREVGSVMTPNRKVSVLTFALTAMVLVVAWPLAASAPALITGATWWYFVPAFLLAERALAHVEIREETQTLSLSEAVLLLGLVLLSPHGLIAARLIGSGTALALRRLPLAKLAFNAALFAGEAAIASVFLHLVFRPQSTGPGLWAFAGLSVFLATTFGAGVVACVISFFDSDRPLGLLRGVFQVQIFTATASISLAIVGAAAFARSATNLAYLALLVGGVLMLLKKQTSTAQRASDLQSVGQFTATLVGATGTKEVVVTSLREVARTMRSEHAAIFIDPRSGVSSQTYGREVNGFSPSNVNQFDTVLADLDTPALFADSGHPDTTSLPTVGVAAPIEVGGCVGMVVVWDRATGVGEFLSSDPRMLGSMVSQVEVALDRARLTDQLHYDAHHDALTKLPNRLGFTEQLQAAAHESGTLFVLDLDRFKVINDTLGHPTGDEALKIIARRLQRAVGTDTILARLGGDEFAAFSPHCVDIASASLFAERLFDSIEAPLDLQDLSLQLGASVGFAVTPMHGNDLTTLMSHADTAMYEAKRHQVGWQVYRQETDPNDPRQLELISALRHAINARELDVWYQPRISLEDGSLVGAEALARWIHPHFGFVPPDEFIGLAEGAGLMRDLTDAIFEQVVEDICRWDESGIRLQIAVNLSARNLHDDSLPRRVAQALEGRHIETDRISFEITETAIMVDRERVVGLLQELRDLGIAIAIDDYGTGYSSLTYLRELPADELKIDRSFISNIDLDAHNFLIVRSTIDLAHNLGLVVTAEGIERQEELNTLTELGCDFAQGYLISKPVPTIQFEEWVVAHRPVVLV
jgi:diguanylate cyclase (GGDEF)-like protein